jgi:hypothetical protein
MNLTFGSLLAALLTIVIPPWGHVALAEYTLVLKNGRRITVQAYREEGNTIKFYGIGGEIGIGKDQVQSILKAGEGEGRGLSLSGPASSQGEASEGSQEERKPAAQSQRGEARSEAAGPPATGDESAPPELTPADQAAKEEQEYQRRMREVTDQIKSTMERYNAAAKGSSTVPEALLGSEDAIRRRTDDLNARLRDQQHNPGGPADAGGVKLATPSPFTGQPPVTTELRPGEVVPRVEPPVPVYSERERDLSTLRNQVNELVKERQRLIEEMRQKNLQTGDLFE